MQPGNPEKVYDLSRTLQRHMASPRPHCNRPRLQKPLRCRAKMGAKVKDDITNSSLKALTCFGIVLAALREIISQSSQSRTAVMFPEHFLHVVVGGC